MESDLLGIIGNIGFPAFFCYYFMTSMKKSLDKLTTAINHQTTILYTMHPTLNVQTYENEL